jgi:alpha-amylase
MRLLPPAEVLDGILDYPTYFALTKAFNSPSGNLSGAVDIFTQSQNSYQNGAFSIGSFIENHDQPRFLNITSDLAVRLFPSIFECDSQI